MVELPDFFATPTARPDGVSFSSAVQDMLRNASPGAIRQGAEFQVNTYTGGTQRDPSITTLTDGSFVVTWTSRPDDRPSSEIFGQRYDINGTPIGSEFRINDTTSGWQSRSSVTALEDGGFVVTWETNQFDHSRADIAGRRYDANGVAVGGDFEINTRIGGDQTNPSVTSLADGGFVVAWSSAFGQDGDGVGIFGQRYDAAGVAVGAEFRINTYTNSDQMLPAIASLNDGGFVVTWMSYAQDGSDYGIFGQRYAADGTPSGAEFQINTHAHLEQEAPAVTALADGGFVVTWASDNQDGVGHGLFGQRFAADGTAVGSEFQVNTYTNGQQAVADVTMLADGGFIVAWQSYSQDGSDYGIYGQRFDAAGDMIGTEFRINSHTPRTQENCAITSFDDGGFAVTWDSHLQDGSERGIYAQRYAPQFWGTSGDNTIVDDVGANWINGRDGHDSLSGLSGDDTIYGEGGNDTVLDGVGSDFLLGQTGNDSVSGAGGHDHLRGGIGGDTLLGGLGNDTLLGQGGADLLDGEAGRDDLYGGDGNDTVRGGEGADIVRGQGGADQLFGGAGLDWLRGGRGNDTYVFESAGESGIGRGNRDVIGTWDQGDDIIDLSAIDAIIGGSDDAFVFVGNGPHSGAGGTLRVFTEHGNTVIGGDLDGNMVDDFQIQIVGLHVITGGDFIL